MLKVVATLLFISSLHSSFALAQGNGGERNGGDIYIGEFKEIERSILSKLEQWRKTGVLKISEKQVQRMQTGYETQKVHSRLHACIFEQGEGDLKPCLKQEHERAVINDHRTKPPYFVIGRQRWDEMKRQPDGALLLETTVLHEMMEAFLSDGVNVMDKSFEQSYKIKLESIKDWESFKANLKQFLREFNLISHEESNFDLSNFTTFFETLKLNADYDICMTQETDEASFACLRILDVMNYAIYGVREFAKDPSKMNVFELLAEVLDEDDHSGQSGFLRKTLMSQEERLVKRLNDNIQGADEYIKSAHLPDAWVYFAIEQYKRVLTARKQAIDEQNAKVADPEFQKNAREIERGACKAVEDKGPIPRLRCLIENTIPAFTVWIQQLHQPIVDRVEAAYQFSLDKLNETVDPPQN